MTRLQKAERENRYLRRLLMECSHVLTFARNKGIVNERLKERIQAVLSRDVSGHAEDSFQSLHEHPK